MSEYVNIYGEWIEVPDEDEEERALQRDGF